MNTLLAIIAIAVACVDIYFHVKHNKQSRKTIYLSKEAPPQKESAPTKPPTIGDDKCPFCGATIIKSEITGAISDKKYLCGTKIYICGSSKDIKRSQGCVTNNISYQF